MAKKERKNIIDSDMTFGETLRQLRKDRKISQAELAEFIGVSKVTISAYEVGRILPKSSSIYKMAKLFDVNVDVLLTKVNNDAKESSQRTVSSSRERVLRIDEMMHYFNCLTVGQRRAVVELAKQLAD